MIVGACASVARRRSYGIVLAMVVALTGMWCVAASAQDAAQAGLQPTGSEPLEAQQVDSQQTGKPPLIGVAAAAAVPPQFIANNISLGDVIDAIQGKIGRPMIVSPKMRAMFVTGTFDLESPMATLAKLVRTMGLMTYDDGRSLHLYRDSEVTSSVVQMSHQRLSDVRSFLRSSRLYDEHYPLAGDDNAAVFYVSGPPIYVRLVVTAAKYLDQQPDMRINPAMVLRVVPLHNTFVVNRRYQVRDEMVSVPGVADIIHALFDSSGGVQPQRASSATSVPDTQEDALTDALNLSSKARDAKAAANGSSSDDMSGRDQMVAMKGETVSDVRMVPNPDDNSIVLYGPRAHVDLMERAIHAVDIAKRQIELSLWIIDVDRQKLNELGINWQSSANYGPFTASANGTQTTTLNSITFLATVNALSEKGQANIVSRPIVLTEENLPAIFDNSHTQYYPLVGERTAALEHFTYGTMVSVLPRLTQGGQEVEMIVTVRDGRSQNSASTAKNTPVIPVVSDTQISTVARVPKFKSLLLGGSTIDQHESTTYYIPGLWNIPVVGRLFRLDRTRTEHMVRLFLIQPRVLMREDGWMDGQTLPAGDLMSERSEMAKTSQMLQQYIQHVGSDSEGDQKEKSTEGHDARH
ncbi:type III secretion system outer membrane ring subunit SctC [Xanthomonas phaseoli pv. phaseoli]|uniref:Type 3 secretion system secretin n=1 Tax=Xanthomonas campestris pv. phaseoli TaxID=317013 RepID=A0AB38DTX3_XANCH|nr:MULTISPECIES: type III secretion system outer membrane ring subunit SctC [Xanthomonas]ATS23151.1 type III secretion system outer membrane ring subunit SctC [Xanthomonas phaseoli pv. phaseoli]ATS26048.1 type III secretion system outer membrane ring subunit SctC [Xanthomonas phaseoli pv. phaseoli]ATS30460.2 type III secretion system outer membrane ring subunit SctC [Xanthomonas phaseoli pv. phaseoli]ATS34307.1 type III secretion system outer membrane ring subunit SctC [Xanthomonas phaseoli pv.